jgi:hypothetical protein
LLEVVYSVVSSTSPNVWAVEILSVLDSVMNVEMDSEAVDALVKFVGRVVSVVDSTSRIVAVDVVSEPVVASVVSCSVIVDASLVIVELLISVVESKPPTVCVVTVS